MTLIGTIEVQYFNSICKSKESGIFYPVRESFGQKDILMIQHPNQPVFTYIAITLPINGITKLHVIS